jgi:hypothetical protein
MTVPTMPSQELLAHVRAAHIIAPILLAITSKEAPGFVYAYDENSGNRVLLAFGDNTGEKFWKRCCVVNDKLWRTFPDTSPLSYQSRDPKLPAYGQPLEVPSIGQWGGAAFMGGGVFGGISGLSEAEDEAGALAITAHARGVWDFPHLLLRDEVKEILNRIRSMIPTT